MAAPPAKKSKASNVISMVVEKWKRDQVVQYSAVHRINGFPLRIRLCPNASYDDRTLFLVCEKWREAELWHCTVKTTVRVEEESSSRSRLPLGALDSRSRVTSWNRTSQKVRIADDEFPDGARLVVTVEMLPTDDGEIWRRRPILDPLESRDGYLVIGEEKKKIQVHKESLANQSSFFDRLFNGDFMEKNMVEIPIEGVEYEDFANIIRIVYGFDGVSLTDDNVHQVLNLADRFDLKIVEDRVVNYLLSPASFLTINEKLLIAEQYNIEFLKARLIAQYNGEELEELGESEEFSQLSMATVHALFRRSCKLIAYQRIRLPHDNF